MIKQLAAGFVALIMGAFPGAYAQNAPSMYQSGTALLEECLNDIPELHERCIGYISGIADVMNSDEVGEAQICIPANLGISSGRIRGIVIRWMRGHSEQLHLPARDLIAKALSDVFVCQ